MMISWKKERSEEGSKNELATVEDKTQPKSVTIAVRFSLEFIVIA